MWVRLRLCVHLCVEKEGEGAKKFSIVKIVTATDLSRSPKKARYDPIYGRVHVSILRVKEEEVKEGEVKDDSEL